MQRQIRIAACLLLFFLTTNAHAVTPDEAASAVTARYRVTTPGFLGDFKEIGSILKARREGLRVNRQSNAFRPNVVNDHRLAVTGGGGLPLGGVHEGILKPGERLHLYGVSTGKDYVQLDIHTVATYVVPGSRGPQALQASIRFQYDNGLAGVSSRQLLDDIGEWLEIEGGAPAAATSLVTGRTTSTIRLGQRQDEVIAVFGPPEKQILLGAKSVFIYSNVKVVFLDGKVIDAE